MEEQIIKNWLRNDKFVAFLSRKGLDVANLLSYYRFEREDKTRIASDYPILKQYYEQYAKYAR